MDKKEEEINKPEPGLGPAESTSEHMPKTPSSAPLPPRIPRVGSVADLGNFSVMETSKIIQSTSAHEMDYTVSRSIRMASAPAGLARTFSVLFPDPMMQRTVDIETVSMMTTVAALVQMIEGMDDPSDILDRVKLVTTHGRIAGKAFRAIPIRRFNAVEGGRTLIPAWRPNPGADQETIQNCALSQYFIEDSESGKRSSPQRTMIESLVARWGKQMAVLTDTVTITGSVTRALEDMVLAHMIGRIAPDLEIYFVDPRSVHYNSYNPSFMKVKLPWDDHSLGHMKTIREQVVAQIGKELAAVPDREKLIHPRAKLLYSLMMLRMQLDTLRELYGGKLYVYCGGFANGPYLKPFPDSGTQELMADIAQCLAAIGEMRNVHTEVVSMTFDDPNAPEPYYADLFAKILKFGAHMAEYVGNVILRGPAATHMTSSSAAQRYKLTMEPYYWQQTYRSGTLSIGGLQCSLLIPTYGMQSEKLQRVTAEATSGLMAISLNGLEGEGDRLDPREYHNIPFRTTESPMEICTMIERTLSPYIIAGATDEDLSHMSADFQSALLAYGTRVTSLTYVGNGYAPYRGNFQNGQILQDTAMWIVDQRLRSYLTTLFASKGGSTLTADAQNYFIDNVYIPLGNESTRTGGLALENLLTFFSLTITNPPDEMTLTGPMIFVWSPQVEELLSYRVSTSFQFGRAPYSSR